MKRTICAALALSLAAAFTACGPREPEETAPPTETIAESVPEESGQAPTEEPVQTESVPETEPKPEPKPEPVQTTPTPVVVWDTPQVAVSKRLVVERTQEPGWSYDFTLVYDDVTVSTGNAAVDAKIRQELEADLADTRSVADGMLEDLASFLEEVGEMPSAGSVERIIKPARVDSQVISFNGQLNYYAVGGIHPNAVLKAATFDAATGQKLTLWDVLTEDGVATLHQKVLERLAAYQNDEIVFFPEYEQTVALHFDRTMEFTEDWYLTNQGMVCFFSPYDIAPYAVGQIEILIPYEELSSGLVSAYLPPEAPETTGSMAASLAGEQQPDFQAVLDAEGEQIDLCASGTVTKVLVESVTSYDGTVYESTGVLFAANRLADGQIVRLSAYLADAIPSLRLTYTGSEGTVVRYIFQSGKDGSILLLEE